MVGQDSARPDQLVRPNSIFAERSYPQALPFLADTAIADATELSRLRAP